METESDGQTDVSSLPTNSEFDQEMESFLSQPKSTLGEMESKTTTIPSDSEDEISLQKQRQKMSDVEKKDAYTQ